MRHSTPSRHGGLPLVLLVAVTGIGSLVAVDQIALDGTLTGGAMQWIFEQFTKRGSDILAWLFSTLPDALVPDYTLLEPTIGLVSEWVPLDIGFGLLGAYFAFLAGFIAFKFALKLIPTVG